MLDRFYPTEILDHSSRGSPHPSSNSRSTTNVPGPEGFAAWPANVSVTKVAWNQGGGLGGAGLLASATMSGLCRVDWLADGRWWRDGEQRFADVRNLERDGEKSEVT